jgi:hypothetical protein
MESNPYDAPAGDQLTDGRLFQPLHPTLPKQYGTNSLLWEFERIDGEFWRRFEQKKP